MKNIVWMIVFTAIVTAAQAQPQGIFQRLIKIKYSAELYLINAAKFSAEHKKLDSAMSIYNTIRWNVDGLVYQLSGDLVAANSPKKLRQLNAWCLEENNIYPKIKKKGINIEAVTLKNIEDYCLEYLPAFSPIGNTAKNINLTTNVFYLIKDSYSLIKGLSDLKTQKTMALVEMLDQMRLSTSQDLMKQVK